MKMLEKMNAVINYVENHLIEEIDLKHLANIACSSTFNFQRAFSFITCISIMDYIRQRRLTLAAFELQQSNIKIIDLAMKYGYESPVSFARAFHAIHGITPSKARKSNVLLKAFPKMTFQITITGVSEMNYRIVKTEPFKVFGLEGIVSTVGDKKYFSNEGQIWQQNHINGKYEKLFSDAGDMKSSNYDTMFIHEMCRIHGLVNYKKIDNTTYAYMQCSFVTPKSKSNGYTVVEIPASTWAVFPGALENWDTVSAINALNRQFYREWLPVSDFEKADLPEFEMYGGTPEKGYIELWMPIIYK